MSIQNNQPYAPKQLNRLIVSGLLAQVQRIESLMFVEQTELIGRIKQVIDPMPEDQRFRFPGHRTVLAQITGSTDQERLLTCVSKLRDRAKEVLAEATRNGDLGANKQGESLNFVTIINSLSDSQLHRFISTATGTFYSPSAAMDYLLQCMDPEARSNAQRLSPYKKGPQEALQVFMVQATMGISTDDGIIVSINRSRHPTRNKNVPRVQVVLPAGFDLSSLDPMQRNLTDAECALAMNMKPLPPPPATLVLPPPPAPPAPTPPPIPPTPSDISPKLYAALEDIIQYADRPIASPGSGENGKATSDLP
jgi:hypothetical protein